MSELNLEDDSGFDFKKTPVHTFNLVNTDNLASKILAGRPLLPAAAHSDARRPPTYRTPPPALGFTVMIGFERLGSWTMVVALVVLLCPPTTSTAQSVECEKFAQAADASTQKTDPIEESLWQDPDAVTCFAKELEKIGSIVEPFDNASEGKMFRVTDALRKIMTGIYSQDVLTSSKFLSSYKNL